MISIITATFTTRDNSLFGQSSQLQYHISVHRRVVPQRFYPIRKSFDILRVYVIVCACVRGKCPGKP